MSLLEDIIFNNSPMVKGEEKQNERQEKGEHDYICKITGKHCVGFNLKDDAKITIELYSDRLVFKNKIVYLAEYDMDDILSVDGRYEDVHTGSVTTAQEEFGLASSVAMMQGDWAAAYFLKPNRTKYETKHQIERRYFLEIESFKNTVVLQVESQDDLIAFVDECNDLINAYEAADEDGDYEKPSVESMTAAQFDEFSVKYLEYHDFDKIVLLPKSDDKRVSIVAEKDEVKYAILCVKSDGVLDEAVVENIESGRKSYRCHVGLVMTNGSFSEQAKQLAGERLILLWDGKRLQ